ncbi:hypothetical protein COCC4DRAFT_64117 [Bipolaris maydis ATCC 48331]|uniref:Uncharacterized protein n=2 Tax=Cochliobolus heterostrophus TaxID=5016 RepID=M2V4R2_COCH5|nr:uncharacterized protein COCC4DRAFT_64117 [Bipolaris maydis ATCC 48331]EMD94977.1 hypothetical protein COCHEDRAFT_1152822 [Bipolaris maydis C5]ENI01732.1 hypothetical protein COCC4DRAFT_64117 [Bipolaris maydis ATCC 48331]KAJ6214861.1 hypothetical protein PSV09DRAFT_1152822 [Bipolaris maydis]
MATYTQQQISSSNTPVTSIAQVPTSNLAEQPTAFLPSSASRKIYPTIFTLPHVGREIHSRELIPAQSIFRAESSTTWNNTSLYTDDFTASNTTNKTDKDPEYRISILIQKLAAFFKSLPPNHPREPTFPSFLLPYIPAPSSYASSSCSSGDESDKESTRQKQKQKQKQKRCWVGRPRGAILRPRDRYYSRGLCDKHGSEVLFLENMRIHHGAKGEEGERWHAWRCG